MRQHFHAEPWWLMRTARFLENHDEHRVASRLGLECHMAAAALVAFGPGMRFWHMGQWEGWRKKIPVQIKRNPMEAFCGCLLSTPEKHLQKNHWKTHACDCISAFYERLLVLNRQAVFQGGEWRVVHEHQAEHGLICWLWKHEKEYVLVVINYAEKEAVFSLADQLHLLHLTKPMDMLRQKEAVEPLSIQSLAPWGVYLWKAIAMH
jgi:hypothetical protein